MKIEKAIEKLFVTHGEARSLSEIIRHVGLQKVLLSLSNYCMGRSNECRMTNKEGLFAWKKRAKLLHTIMEEIEAEEKPLN